MTRAVAVALGSNLGDRESHLAYAVEALAALLADLRVSSIIETEPFQTGPQPCYLNAVVTGQTGLPVRLFFEQLRAIERARLRDRPYAGAPRTLDLDLILFGDAVVNEPDLVVPHPRFRDRTFVLGPLAELDPEMRDPVTGRTAADLLTALRPPT